MPVRRRPPGTSIECHGCPTELSVCFSERNSSPDRVYASRFSRIRDCARIGRASPSAWHVGSVPYAERASGARRWTSKVLRRSLRKLRDSFETRTKLVHGVCGAILAFAAPGTKYGRGHEPNFALVRCKRAGHSLVPRGSVTSRFSVTMVSVLERRVADRLARRLRTMRGSRLEACENREERRRLRCAFWAQYTRERRTYMGGGTARKLVGIVRFAAIHGVTRHFFTVSTQHCHESVSKDRMALTWRARIGVGRANFPRS